MRDPLRLESPARPPVVQIVSLRGTHRFNAVHLEKGYGLIEIRSPAEVLSYEEGL